MTEHRRFPRSGVAEHHNTAVLSECIRRGHDIAGALLTAHHGETHEIGWITLVEFVISLVTQRFLLVHADLDIDILQFQRLRYRQDPEAAEVVDNALAQLVRLAASGPQPLGESWRNASGGFRRA